MPRCGYARLGEILKEHGELSEVQVASVLLLQRETGRPFGELAQRMFGLRASAVERAWVQQYRGYAAEVDLGTQPTDRQVLSLLTRRQAWQLQILPLRFEKHELVIATSAPRLAKAVTFAWRRFTEPVHTLLAPPQELRVHLQKHYPWPAMRNYPAGGVVGLEIAPSVSKTVETVPC